MNPEQTAALVRVIITILVGPGSYIVSRGFLTADQANQLAPALMSITTVVAGIVVGKFAIGSHSAAAITKAVNSDSAPGVKVVPDSVDVPAVNITSTGEIKTAPKNFAPKK